jgi:predicted nucleic acid-binding protein
MILVDTSPLVALLDPRDAMHATCKATLAKLREPLCATVPVLTEAFHMLDPGSRGAANLRTFVDEGGTDVWFLDRAGLSRAFELITKYEDHPMDLADASLVVAGERMRTQKIFTLDRRDFEAYRVRKGHREVAWKIVPLVEG